jgi:hypothetical protein
LDQASGAMRMRERTALHRPHRRRRRPIRSKLRAPLHRPLHLICSSFSFLPYVCPYRVLPILWMIATKEKTSARQTLRSISGPGGPLSVVVCRSANGDYALRGLVPAESGHALSAFFGMSALSTADMTGAVSPDARRNGDIHGMLSNPKIRFQVILSC